MKYEINFSSTTDIRQDKEILSCIRTLSNKGNFEKLGTGYSVIDKMYDVEYKINTQFSLKTVIDSFLDNELTIDIYDVKNDKYYFDIS